MNGIEGVLNLGNHTAGNCSVCDITIEVIACDNRDDTIVVIWIRQDTLFLKTESESDIIIRSKSLCRFGSDGVGIGIEDITLTVVGEWCHDGGNASLDESGKHTSVGLIDITHKTIIDTVFQGALVGTDDIHISTSKTEGIDTSSLKLCHHIFVVAALTVAAALSFTACSDDNDAGEAFFTVYDGSNAIESYNFDYTAADTTVWNKAKTLVVRSNRPWKLVPQDENGWLRVFPAEGEGDGLIRLSRTLNNKPDTRTLTYKIYLDGKDSGKTFTVTQTGAEPYLKGSATSFTIARTGLPQL